MKNVYLLSIICFACGVTNIDAAKQVLKRSTGTYFFADGKETKKTVVVDYNTEGVKTKELEKECEGGACLEKLKQFDSLGQVTYEKEVYDGELLYEFFIEYDEKGNTISERGHSIKNGAIDSILIEHRHHYIDTLNKQISFLILKSDTVRRIEIVKQANQETIHWYDQGNGNFELVDKLFITYNEKGLQLSHETRDPQERLLRKQEWRYNEKGKVLNTKIEENGILVLEARNEYEQALLMKSIFRNKVAGNWQEVSIKYKYDFWN